MMMCTVQLALEHKLQRGDKRNRVNISILVSMVLRISHFGLDFWHTYICILMRIKCKHWLTYIFYDLWINAFVSLYILPIFGEHSFVDVFFTYIFIWWPIIYEHIFTARSLLFNDPPLPHCPSTDAKFNHQLFRFLSQSELLEFLIGNLRIGICLFLSLRNPTIRTVARNVLP